MATASAIARIAGVLCEPMDCHEPNFKPVLDAAAAELLEIRLAKSSIGDAFHRQAAPVLWGVSPVA